MAGLTFTGKFTRTGGKLNHEDRAVQPSDFPAYKKAWASGHELFEATYPSWQAYADCFVMRRNVITINGRCTVATENFKADEMEEYLTLTPVTLGMFEIPGADFDSIPAGLYMLDDFVFADLGTGNTEITVQYIQRRTWTLVQIETTLPNPAAAT